jgi:hypothetical protein
MSKVNSTWSDSPFSNSFSYVSLVFVSCSANEVAHLLARSGELATCLIYQHIPNTSLFVWLAIYNSEETLASWMATTSLTQEGWTIIYKTNKMQSQP